MNAEKSKMSIVQSLAVLVDADYTIADLLGLARRDEDGRKFMARRTDDDGDLATDEDEALASLRINIETCDCPGCGCKRPAVTTDDGVPFCRACSDYTFTEGGDVVCRRMHEGWTMCHVCHHTIEWGAIQGDDSGSVGYNHRYGACQCGAHAWLDEERGNWGHYSYLAEQKWITT